MRFPKCTIYSKIGAPPKVNSLGQFLIFFKPNRINKKFVWFLFFTFSCATGHTLEALTTPNAIKSECIRQMEAGICISKPTFTSSKAGQTILISGAGRVSYAAYLDYVEKYNIKSPTDTAMCDLAFFYMKTAPGSDHDKIARAMWTPEQSSPKTKR